MRRRRELRNACDAPGGRGRSQAAKPTPRALLAVEHEAAIATILRTRALSLASKLWQRSGPQLTSGQTFFCPRRQFHRRRSSGNPAGREKQTHHAAPRRASAAGDRRTVAATLGMMSVSPMAAETAASSAAAIMVEGNRRVDAETSAPIFIPQPTDSSTRRARCRAEIADRNRIVRQGLDRPHRRRAGRARHRGAGAGSRRLRRQQEDQGRRSGGRR